MKKLFHTVIRLSFQEYADSWAELIYSYYQRGMSDEELFRAYPLTEEKLSQYSLELSTTLLLIAILSFGAKPKLVTREKNLEKLQQLIADESYGKIFPQADKETLSACRDYYEKQYALFSQICKNIQDVKAEKRQSDLIGFARYLTAQVFAEQEENGVTAIGRLGLLFVEASDSFQTLLMNTTQDTVGLNGKPSFSVKKSS